MKRIVTNRGTITSTDDGSYCISKQQMWLKGVYDSEESARQALWLNFEQQAKLQQTVNIDQARNITVDDITEVKKHEAE